jgi:rhodanese-related sulfurtransferase
MELAVAQTERDSEAVEAAIIDLTAAQLREKIASGDVRLIDVRRDDETAQGVIPGAEHIALDNFDPATLDLSDGREVVIYCRSGRRSRIAAEQLAAHTGEQVRHLEGGILAWQEAGGPIAHD